MEGGKIVRVMYQHSDQSLKVHVHIVNHKKLKVVVRDISSPNFATPHCFVAIGRRCSSLLALQLPPQHFLKNPKTQPSKQP